MNRSSSPARLLLLLVAATSLATVLPTAAWAAGPLPPFQLPVPCGQTWRASTYALHWNGDQDALDLAQRGDAQQNLSDGEFALAAAAGSVQAITTTGSGEHRVFLDHGAGWTTAYIHLKELPPLTVGQQVAQGEVVGVVSNSGAVSPHLHYNQTADGSPVRATFNGALVDTHAGNVSSWNTYGTDSAEALTSVNCLGGAFAAFNQNGLRYQILYKPASGDLKIVRVNTDGTGTTTVWSGAWGRQWTHIVPFYLVGGQAHVFMYSAATGAFRYERVNGQGLGLTTIAQGTWWAGWTHITPFVIDGRPYFLVYDSLHGYANVERVNVAATGTTTISSSAWTKGWTHLVPYQLGATQYLLLYKGGSGAVKIHSITGSGDALTFAEVWSSTWTAGWSHLVAVSHQGSSRLFAYRAATGEVSYSRFNASGQGTQHLGGATWSANWTAITPMLFATGEAGLFLYRAASGSAQVRQWNALGDGSAATWSAAWTAGWR